jgi:hypothetical protein
LATQEVGHFHSWDFILVEAISNLSASALRYRTQRNLLQLRVMFCLPMASNSTQIMLAVGKLGEFFSMQFESRRACSTN